MKNRYALIFFLSAGICHGQNLVPNPSFEEYEECPNQPTNEIEKATGWMNFGNTPEYFNACSTNPFFGIPNTGFGYQYPASGQAMMGLCPYYAPDPDYRETISIQLTEPLQAGTKYYVSLKINHAHSPPDIYYHCIAVNKLGVKFTNTVYSELSPAPADNISHVYSDSIMTDTLNWFTVFGSFTPTVSYQYLMIGNFFDDNNTDTLFMCDTVNFNHLSYYFIDDVCVSTDSVFAYNYTYLDIDENTINNRINVYPNPSNGNITISSDEAIRSYVLYSSLGQMVLNEEIVVNPYQQGINLTNYSSGVYFLNIKTDNSIIRKKLIIN